VAFLAAAWSSSWSGSGLGNGHDQWGRRKAWTSAGQPAEVHAR
jgi:hypothetical protein